MLLLDLRGLRLGAAERAQLLERTKYTSVQFKVDAPGSAPAVCAEEQAGETTQPEPLPSDGASVQGAVEAEPRGEAGPPLTSPLSQASGHAEAWLAELPHMNLF